MTRRAVLAFDTSGPYITAALRAGDDIVASDHEDMARGQAERLMPLLEGVLATGGIGWHDLSALAVGIGPGNFTGIRISVAAARGLALGLSIPAVGVELFDALAWGTEGVRIVTLPAPRDQVYAKVVGNGPSAPVLGRPSEIELESPDRAEPSCIGEAADVMAQRFAGHVAAAKYPLATALADIGAARQNQTNLPRPAPLYVRPADAAPSRDVAPKILT